MEFHHISLDEVDSTNNYAAKMIQMTKHVNPSVITARYQTHGKGQRGKVWESSANSNLMTSFIIFNNHLQIENLYFLNKSIANAVHSTILYFLPNQNISIKWPNDIWVNGKKIAGILIENQWRGAITQSSIIGIGINTNEHYISSKDRCSISDILKTVSNNDEILSKLTEYLSDHIQLVEQEKWACIDLYYHQHLLGSNSIVTCKERGRTFPGYITKVDSQGNIIVRHEDQMSSFAHGSIEIEYQ